MAHDTQITEEEYKRAIAVIDDAYEKMHIPRMDETSKAVRVSLWWYNTDTLKEERVPKGAFHLNVQDLTVSMDDMEKLAAGSYWKDQRFDWTSGDLDYKGLSTTHKADEAAGDLWLVWKYTWAAGNLTRIQGPIVCNWDDRAAESW